MPDYAAVVNALMQTWPARLAETALNAAKLPGDVYQGNVPVTGPDGYTNPEVINRSADLAGMVTGGSFAAPAEENAVGMGIRAYHGSPYDFDKFDLSKIGTGEGAQAYGHGLYFAENPAVAQEYKARLSGGPIVGGVDPFRDMSWLSANTKGVAAQALQDSLRGGLSGDDAVRDAIGSLTSTVAKFPNMEAPTRQAHYDAANAIGSLLGKEWQRNPGRMYEVNINADPQQFLDWDKPLSQQGAPVQSALERFGIKAQQQQMRDYDNALLDALSTDGPSAPLPKQPWDPLGANIYESSKITPGVYRDKVGAASALNQAGVAGIKYLDQGSRAAGDGSRNYVVFNPSIIDIMKKYGLAGLAAPAVAGGAAANNSRPPFTLGY